MKPTVDRLRQVFTLDKQGRLIRNFACSKAKVGEEAGDINNRGYRRVTVDGSRYLAHRIVWTMHTGFWPSLHIDHINGDRSDNRPENLRQATNGQNLCNRGAQKNNKLGLKGVHFSARKGKYVAQIAYGGKHRFIGHFSTAEEAHAAYLMEASINHGEFAKNDHVMKVAA